MAKEPEIRWYLSWHYWHLAFFPQCLSLLWSLFYSIIRDYDYSQHTGVSHLHILGGKGLDHEKGLGIDSHSLKKRSEIGVDTDVGM